MNPPPLCLAVRSRCWHSLLSCCSLVQNAQVCFCFYMQICKTTLKTILTSESCGFFLWQFVFLHFLFLFFNYYFCTELRRLSVAALRSCCLALKKNCSFFVFLLSWNKIRMYVYQHLPHAIILDWNFDFSLTKMESKTFSNLEMWKRTFHSPFSFCSSHALVNTC